MELDLRGFWIVLAIFGFICAGLGIVLHKLLEFVSNHLTWV